MIYKCEDCGYEADAIKDDIYTFCPLCAENRGYIKKGMKVKNGM